MVTDQNRANAFLKRLIKSVTPHETQVWKPGIGKSETSRTAKQRFVAAAAKQKQRQYAPDKLVGSGEAVKRERYQYPEHQRHLQPKVRREIIHLDEVPQRYGGTLGPEGRPRRRGEIVRSRHGDATVKERLRALENMEEVRKQGYQTDTPNVTLRMLQSWQEQGVGYPRHHFPEGR